VGVAHCKPIAARRLRGQECPRYTRELDLPLLSDDGFEISAQLWFGVGFEIEEHDSVAELGVAGDDASANNDGMTVKPESRLDSDANR
jgi:hypothetical protein